MGLLDALSQIANAISQNSQPQQSHVDEIVREAPRDTVREGLREAFDANDTPSLGEQVGQMFGQSSNQQQAGLINQVIQALSACAAADKLTIWEQDAGLHFLLHVDTAWSDARLTAWLQGLGIRVQPLSAFYHDRAPGDLHDLVVNYSGITDEQLTQALDRLNEACRENLD